MISFMVFYAYNSNSFTYLKQKKKKVFPFDMFSITQLRALRRQEHIYKGLLKGTKQIYKLDVTASVLKFQNHLDVFVPPPTNSHPFHCCTQLTTLEPIMLINSLCVIA